MTRTCQSDDDCHFIDCQGKCVQNKCQIDEQDTDLKRICRNIFFMGSFYSTFEVGLLSKGVLFSTEDKNLDQIRQKIYELCFDSENNFHHNQDLVYIDKMKNILFNY